MHRLLEYQMKNDLFMSCRPDVNAGRMVVTFRKTLSNGQQFWRTYPMSEVEINRLNVDNVDVILDFAEKFMKEFNAEDEKFW